MILADQTQFILNELPWLSLGLRKDPSRQLRRYQLFVSKVRVLKVSQPIPARYGSRLQLTLYLCRMEVSSFKSVTPFFYLLFTSNIFYHAAFSTEMMPVFFGAKHVGQHLLVIGMSMLPMVTSTPENDCSIIL